MIYTSNYWEILNKEHNLKNPIYIQISSSCPPNFNPDGIWSEVVPSWYGLVKPFKDGELTEQQYLNKYRWQVKDAAEKELFLKIIDELKSLEEANERDVVLLCWCGKESFCHRHWLREYLNINYKLNIQEL